MLTFDISRYKNGDMPRQTVGKNFTAISVGASPMTFNLTRYKNGD